MKNLIKRSSIKENCEVENKDTNRNNFNMNLLITISNLSFISDNHKYIFQTKIPYYLFKFLNNDLHFYEEYYKYAITCKKKF